jgi:hypothetical protein
VLQATTDASAAPLGGQLLNVELVGLIVLFSAVIIAVVRVALRTPKPARAAAATSADQTSVVPEAAKSEAATPTASQQGWRHWIRAPRLRRPRVRSDSQ